ncbi:DNA/RNA non-specific endonuclease [Pseudarthrobacter oxydans]|uniref:DNA/RNA non-specific endonuclease n=1 Tax=Pseudarthrobacter oxydans TaxID=1671 RepID=UPI0037F7A1BA
MVIPDDVLTATQARFQARKGPRAGTEEKIAEAHTPQGSILNVDAPERVELRSRRVMRQPVVRDALKATAETSPAARGQVRDELVLERIIGGNNLLGIAFLELGTAVARSVGRVIVRDRFQIRSFGTGFMISPRLALTNNHVLADAQSARFSRLEFNFQNGVSGLPLAASQFDLEPDTFFRTDSGLDVTVVAVVAASRPDGAGASVPLAGFGFNRTSKEQGKILLGESINIIQHPEGQEKQLALQQNELIDRFDQFLHYHTDTSPGSSGSPLFNNQWEVLGLHHSGVPARNAAGDILTVDGTVWDSTQDELRIQWVANEGIRISSILAWLGANADGMTNEERALLEEALNPPPLPADPPHPAELLDPVELDPVVERQGPVEVQLPQPVEQPVATAEGAVSLTIPLHITVRLGAVQAAHEPAPSSAGRTAGPGSGDAVGPGSGDAIGTGSALAEEAVAIDPDYEGRKGYDPDFLDVPVPLPVLTAEQRAEAAQNRRPAQGQDPTVLNYHHFSLVMHRSRRLALYTAVNVDGRLSQSPKRDRDKWYFDPRLDRSEQIGGDLYAGNDFDRGHLVRRLDPAWGPDAAAKAANDDTFHFTNCSPQHKNFNQGASLWAGLEDYVLDTAKAEKLRLSVFTGPVFTANDPEFQAARIPLSFWKMLVFQRPDGSHSASAYMISQHELVEGILREAFTPVTFQVPIRRISELTGLDFGHLFGWDPMNDEFEPLPRAQEALATPTPARELRTLEDVQL